MATPHPDRRNEAAEAAQGWRPTLLHLMAAHQRNVEEDPKTRIVVDGCTAHARRARGAINFDIDVCDLSLHGIGFQTREQLAPGQQLIIRFPEEIATSAWLVEARWTADVGPSLIRVGAEIIEQTNWKG